MFNIIYVFHGHQAIVEVWSEVYQERGEKIATIGVIQLILDRLRMSLIDKANERDFEISQSVELRTFNMDSLISTLTENQVSWIWQHNLNFVINILK